MKKICVLLVLSVIIPVWSLQVLPAHGDAVSPATEDTLFYYHTRHDDLHLSGVDSWAVRFAYDEFYTGVDSLQFAAQGAWCYFPTTPVNQLELVLTAENINQPSTQYTTQVVPASELNSGWNYIPFDATYTDSVLWLIANYDTPTTQPLSASLGGGQHSYFYSDEYYYSFSSITLNAELLFSLQGFPVFLHTDLELLAFSMEADPANPGRIYPVFTVMNNSPVSVSNFQLHFTVDTAQNSVHDSVLVAQTLEPLAVEQFSYVGGEHAFTLLDQAAQYAISGRVYHPDDICAGNNSLSSQFDTFDEPMDGFLLENIVQLDDLNSSDIWMEESSIIDPAEATVLNYFPDVANIPYFSLDAQLRQAYYDLPGIPTVIIGGEDFIIGYSTPFFSDSLISYQENLINNATTFVSDAGATGQYNPTTDRVIIHVTLQNTHAYVMSDYLGNCTFYMAIAEQDTSASAPVELYGDIFHSMVLEAPVHLSHDSTEVFTANFVLSNCCTPLGQDTDRIRYIYWMQNDDDHRIFLTGSIAHQDLEEVQVSSGSPVHQPGMHVSLSSNPVLSTMGVRINYALPAAPSGMAITVYNVKGQRVRNWHISDSQARSSIDWNCTDSQGKAVASGVYFFKVQASGYPPVITKGLVLKQ